MHFKLSNMKRNYYCCCCCCCCCCSFYYYCQYYLLLPIVLLSDSPSLLWCTWPKKTKTESSSNSISRPTLQKVAIKVHHKQPSYMTDTVSNTSDVSDKIITDYTTNKCYSYSYSITLVNNVLRGIMQCRLVWKDGFSA